MASINIVLDLHDDYVDDARTGDIALDAEGELTAALERFGTVTSITDAD